MKDNLIDEMLREISEGDRGIIEGFFETYTQRMLDKMDVEKVRTAQRVAMEPSEFQFGSNEKDVNPESDTLKFLTPTSELSDLPNLPDMDWGAPAHVILAGEHKLSVSYYLSEMVDWDGETIRPREPKTDEQLMAIFYITGVSSFSQRPTLQPDHLCPYLIYTGDSYPSHGVWEIESGARNDFEKTGLAYQNDKHLIFSFHDTAIECFCTSYKFEIVKSVSLDLVPKLAEFVYSR